MADLATTQAPTARQETTDGIAPMVDLRDDPAASVVAAKGEIDIAVAPRLYERLLQAIEGTDDYEVQVDLRQVTFIDSTGLGVLLNARQRASGQGKKLRLLLPEGRARFPFEVTGLAHVFES